MRRGFTLVELMVVVAIIAVLVAMLIPAVEKAAYEARLARCLAQLHGIAAGAHAYAVGHQSHYPVPPAGRRLGHQPDELAAEGVVEQDMRPVIRNYVPLNALQCPLTGQIDLSEQASDPTAYVHASYAMQFGREMRDGHGDGGMFRIGDRLGWEETQTKRPNDYEQEGAWYFSVIASDVNNFNGPGNNSTVSHHDLDRRLRNVVQQNVLESDGRYVTGSRWMGNRLKLDLNFAFTDGSAQLYREVGRSGDVRMRYTPTYNNGEGYDATTRWRYYMPPVH
jgi:prepilin-type N-terminal cleavage/methylation domain-containing protein